MRLGKQQGFTYFAVLAMVSALSIMAYQVADGWSAGLAREKEAELLFNGNQIARAIQRYYESGPVGGCYPPDMAALLEDRRGFHTERHLRKMYLDPMTNSEDWGLIQEQDGRIAGVYSRSTEQPLRRKGFSKENKDFEGKMRYIDWIFLPKVTTVPPAAPALCR